MTDTSNHAPDSQHWQALANASQLQNGGVGVRFEVQNKPAFAIKHKGQVYAYLNQCAHVAMEMDWQAGQFFDADAQFIMCATHGAVYEPDTGRCTAGPCVGKQLKSIPIRFYDNTYYASRYAS